MTGEPPDVDNDALYRQVLQQTVKTLKAIEDMANTIRRVAESHESP